MAQPVHAEDLPVGLAVVGEHAGAEVVSGGDGPAAGVLRGREREREEEQNVCFVFEVGDVTPQRRYHFTEVIHWFFVNISCCYYLLVTICMLV